MLFNSLEFVIYFPVVTLLYFLLPHRFRWLHLLVASCVFYMFFIPAYILILAFTIVIDYFAGILIENAEGKRRKVFLVMSLAANVGVLFVFKYYNFFNENLAQTAQLLNIEYALPALSILLPVGLSFHTFQAMSYTIEVYRANQKAERHFGIYALYVMFYPQLVAGPIVRALGGRPRGWPYRPVSLPLARKLVSVVGRVDYARVRIVQDRVEPLAIGGASILSSTTRADGFVVVPVDLEGYAIGANVTVWLYDAH